MVQTSSIPAALFNYTTADLRVRAAAGRALRVDQYINFAPETVETYELGLKATLADGKVRLNSSLFSMDYRWNDGKYEVSASCTNCFDEVYFERGTYIGTYAGVWTGARRFYRLGPRI